MHIDDASFAHRKVLQNDKSKQYSPKKRWDQNSFGTERNLLFNHVQNTLKEHQHDGDILQKFRKQAQQERLRKRKQKFPHLYSPSTQQTKPYVFKSNSKQSHTNQFLERMTFKQPEIENQIQRQSYVMPQQLPQLNYPIFTPPPQNYMVQLQSRLQYQRMIAQRDLQLYKKQEKIKKQKKEIKKLYSKLHQKQREDELQKYIKSHEQIKNINKMLIDMKEQISSRKSLFEQTKKVLSSKSQLDSEVNERRNRSELFLNNYNKLSNRIKQKQYDINEVNEQYKKNPQISYSPGIKKNRSSIFENVSLLNPVSHKVLVSEHLNELKNYNKRLEYLNEQNQLKLNQIN